MDRNLDRRVEALVRVTDPAAPGRADHAARAVLGRGHRPLGPRPGRRVGPGPRAGRAWSTCSPCWWNGPGPGRLPRPDRCRPRRSRPRAASSGAATPPAPRSRLVHRPRYDDWSLPKGKLNAREHPLLGALREIEEETGSTARPGRRLGSLRYLVPEGRKRVRYWACEATGGRFEVNSEVDEIWWATAGRGKDPARPGARRPGAQAVRGQHQAHPLDRGGAARVGRGQAGLGRRRRRPATGPEGARAVGHDRFTPHGVRRGAGRQRRRAPLPRDPRPAGPGRRRRHRGPPDHDGRRVRRRPGERGPRGPGPGDEHERAGRLVRPARGDPAARGRPVHLAGWHRPETAVPAGQGRPAGAAPRRGQRGVGRGAASRRARAEPARAGPRSRGDGFGVPVRTDGGDASTHSRGGAVAPVRWAGL